MKKKTSIAFFDFDGTITTNDSFLGFLRYFAGTFRFYLGLLSVSPYIVLFLLGLIKDYHLKTRVCRFFLKGKLLTELEEKAHFYGRNILPKMIRKGAIKKIRWHRKSNHQVVIVSASFRDWLIPFCKKYQLDLIATKLESKDGILTGNLQGANCKGLEKVTRIKQKYDLNNYDMVYAYGDSSGDREMLQMADEGFYKPFH